MTAHLYAVKKLAVDHATKMCQGRIWEAQECGEICRFHVLGG